MLQPDVVEAFHHAGIATQALGVVAHERYYLNSDGSIAQPMPMRQMLTSWNLLYGVMRRHFPAQNYHTGKQLSEIQQISEQVTAIFADGTQNTADLLIGADGLNSTVRQHFLPEAHYRYAGYVAWRGLVNEAELGLVHSGDKTVREITYEPCRKSCSTIRPSHRIFGEYHWLHHGT